LPVPWVGPVLAPVLVSAAMIGAGIYHLWREASGKRVRIGRRWYGITAGAGSIVLAFALDYRNVMAGGMAHRFSWGVLALGLGGGLLSYVNAAVVKTRPEFMRIPETARPLL